MHFLETLGELKGGRVATQLHDAQADLVAAVKKYGGKGEMVIKLKVVPERITDGEVKEVAIAYELKVTKPQPNHGKTTFFVNDDADLCRNDPAQMALQLEVEDIRRPQ